MYGQGPFIGWLPTDGRRRSPKKGTRMQYLTPVARKFSRSPQAGTRHQNTARGRHRDGGRNQHEAFVEAVKPVGPRPKRKLDAAVSVDIWDKKYRLKKDGRGHRCRHRRHPPAASPRPADAEPDADKRAYWYHERQCGRCAARAIFPPAASPECRGLGSTQAGHQHDQLHRVGDHHRLDGRHPDKVHEAGKTLKAGCGIGYEFSTLRPRGAYVAGAGAYTSGPMSFMDIYDKMCFTVSSPPAAAAARRWHVRRLATRT